MGLGEADRVFLRRSFDLARLAAAEGDEPFGAVIVLDDVIIAEGMNYVLRSGDPTRHAELEAIREAVGCIDRSKLGRATIYSSAEPCLMCAGAIYWCKMARVVFGCAHASFRKCPQDRGHWGIEHALQGSPSSTEVFGPFMEEDALVVIRECWPDGAVIA